MNIITVTPHVAIDQTITLDRLTPGQVHRAKHVAVNAGGKGVNVSSCLADWGMSSTLTGFLGSDNAAPFEELCRKKSLGDAFVRVDGENRTNIKIVDTQGTTDINLPGTSVSERDVDGLLQVLQRAEPRGGWIFLCGSLPPGCPENFYALAVDALVPRGWRVLLDASETPLTLALEGRIPPHAVKPNRDELSHWAGKPLHGLGDVAQAVRGLHGRGVSFVAVSMGEDGALFSDGREMVLARLAAGSIRSTTGAGDAMVAGMGAAFRERAGLERLSALATAFAVGKLECPGPNLPGRDRVEELSGLVEIVFLEA